MPHRGSRRAGLLLLVLLPACSGYQWFRSRERVVTDSPDHAPASLYPLRLGPDDDGTARGTVTLWSRGGDVEDGVGRIHVGFVLHNPSSEPWSLDDDVLLLEVETDGGRTLERLQPLTTAGTRSVAPGARVRFDAWFAPGVAPRRVRSFEVLWRARCADGRVYEELTPFAADSLKTWYPSFPTTQFWRDS